MKVVVAIDSLKGSLLFHVPVSFHISNQLGHCRILVFRQPAHLKGQGLRISTLCDEGDN